MTSRLTSLMSLIAIQLFPPSTRRSNNLGASGRKSWGLLHPSSQTTFTIAAVTLASSLSSSKRSLILGHAGRSVSGYTRASRYSVTTVFLRTIACECVNRGIKSERTELAMLGFMTCGMAPSGSAMYCGLELMMSFLSWFSASTRTSVSRRKLCTAAKYPVRFCLNLELDMTSRTLKLAQDMSWPNISR